MVRTLIILLLFICVFMLGFRLLKVEKSVKELSQYQSGLHREIGETNMRLDKWLP